MRIPVACTMILSALVGIGLTSFFYQEKAAEQEKIEDLKKPDLNGTFQCAVTNAKSKTGDPCGSLYEIVRPPRELQNEESKFVVLGEVIPYEELLSPALSAKIAERKKRACYFSTDPPPRIYYWDQYYKMCKT